MDHDMRVTDKRGTGNPDAYIGETTQEMTPEDISVLHRQAAQDDSTMPDPNFTPILTAFAVFIDFEGNVQATADLELLNTVELSRAATFPDMYSAAAMIQKDIAGQEIAQRVLTSLQQQAQRSQEALTAAQVQQRLMGAPTTLGRR